jgi:hypothetical protein
MENIVLIIGWFTIALILLLAIVKIAYKLYYAFEKFKYLKTGSAISAILEDETFDDVENLDFLCEQIRYRKKIRNNEESRK